MGEQQVPDEEEVGDGTGAGMQPEQQPLDPFQALLAQAHARTSEQAEASAKPLPEHAATSNSELLKECDVTVDERRARIQERIANLADVATQAGQRLAQLSDTELANPEVVAELISTCEELGLSNVAEMLQDRSDYNRLNISALSEYFRWLIEDHSINGANTIFSNLSVDNKSMEEGARRRTGEQALVFAKTYLLTISLQAVDSNDLETAGNSIYDSKVHMSSYPDWFNSGIETKLRSMEIGDMDFGSIELLDLIANHIAPRFNSVSQDNIDRILASQEPEALTGTDYIYRKLIDLRKKAEELRTEKQRQLDEAEYTKTYETNAHNQYAEIAINLRDQVTQFLAAPYSNWGGPVISLEYVGVLGKIISAGASDGWWATNVRIQSDRAYNAPQLMLKFLRTLTQEESIKKTATRMLEPGNSAVQYYDASGHRLGRIQGMPQELAMTAVRNTAERALFAAIYGIVLGHIEREDPQSSELDADKARLEAMVDAFSAVAPGRAEELLRLSGSFSESQLRFRNELMQYYVDSTTNNPKFHNRLVAILVPAAEKADLEVSKQMQEKAEKDAALKKLKDKLTDLLAKTNEVAINVTEARMLAKKASAITSLSSEKTQTFLTVTGVGEKRMLAMTDPGQIAKSLETIIELRTQIADATPNNLPINLVEDIANLTADIQLSKKLEQKIAALRMRRIVTPDGRFRYGSAQYPRDVIVEAPDKKQLDTDIKSFGNRTEFNDQYSAEVGLLTKLKEVVPEATKLLNASETRQIPDLEKITATLEQLITSSRSLVDTANQLVARAADAGVAHVFDTYGPLYDLNRAKGTFKDIVQSG